MAVLEVADEQGVHGVPGVRGPDEPLVPRHLARIAERGLEPTERETYDNGVRKATFHDPDGNEIGFGGAPV
jgi:hypothetical protein